MKKYLILDFGKVLAYPKTGDWFITPLFLELIDMDKITREDILKVIMEIFYRVKLFYLKKNIIFFMIFIKLLLIL